MSIATLSGPTPLNPSAGVERTIGDLLRLWRQRRRLSQMALALDAEISPKHLSFVESGRSQPSREMVVRLAERLALPLREQNQLLLSAGYAPLFRERPLDHPELQMARHAVDLILKGHEPFPAMAIDRHWTMIAANRAVMPLLAGVSAELLKPPVNVLRLSLHPDGLASRIVNLGQWRAHIFGRLQQQINATGDPVLTQLLRELRAYPGPDDTPFLSHNDANFSSPVVPILLRVGDRTLSLLGTVMIFGTPIDVTLSELAIETLFAADADTAKFLSEAMAALPGL